MTMAQTTIEHQNPTEQSHLWKKGGRYTMVQKAPYTEVLASVITGKLGTISCIVKLHCVSNIVML